MNFKITLLLMVFGVLNYAQAHNILSNGVPCSEKRIIIDTHNELRKRLANGQVPGQPKAGNLQKFAWDDQLAVLAQNYANRMEFKHNQNRKDGRFKVGENLFTQWSTDSNRNPTWRDVIVDWFDEHKIYKYKPLVSDPKTGHYTQVVWFDTKYVGCGFTFYKKNGVYNKLYVCNYGPTGNFIGKYPYTVGNGCENLCCSGQCSKLYGQKC